MIISMEPMEAMRYLSYLNKEGWIITSSNTFKNIPNYPEEEQLNEELNSLSNVMTLAIEDVAKENSMPKSANVILLGMAAKHIGILTPEQLRESVARVFASKGEAIVEMNLNAFDLGLSSTNK